jgi:hypothetical protein
MLTVLPDVPHSPAMAFLAHAWAHRSRAVQASSQRTKEGMQRTLILAIHLGLPFALNDFTWLMTNQRSSSYDTSPLGFHISIAVNNRKNCGEEWYITAIQHNHTTACQSFEHWKGRRPFFVQGTRLHLDAEMTWQAHRTFVTSFNDEAGTLTACSYDEIRRHYRGGSEYNAGYGPIKRRFTITHTSLAAATRNLHTTTPAHSGAVA